jgi:hypothetical protein
MKTGNRPKANQLLRNARRDQWGLEPNFSYLAFNKFLESGDDLALSAAVESSWARYTTGQAVQLTGKSRKTLNVVGRKRNSRPFSSAITKRRVTAQSRFKKHRLIAKARLAPEATNSAPSQNERMIVDKGEWRCQYMRRGVLASRFSTLSNDDVDVDVAGLEEVASDSVEKRRGRKRKVCPLTIYKPFSY